MDEFKAAPTTNLLTKKKCNNFKQLLKDYCRQSNLYLTSEVKPEGTHPKNCTNFQETSLYKNSTIKERNAYNYKDYIRQLNNF